MVFLGDRGVVVWNESNGPTQRSYRKWATTLDAGQSWSYGGDFWNPIGEEAGHVRLVADANGTFYLARLSLLGGARLSRGRFAGDSFAWDSELSFLSGTVPRQEHPWLDIDPASGTLYYTYTQFASYYLEASAVMFTRSLDAGNTWSVPMALSADSCSGGRSVVDADGALTVVWTDATRNAVICRRSLDHGATFGPQQSVAPFDDNINTLPAGTRRGIVVNPRYPLAYSFPNWPALAVDRSAGPHRGRLYAAWVQQVQGIPAGETGGRGEEEPNNTPAQANPVEIGWHFAGSIPSSDLGGPTDPDYFAFEGRAGQTVLLSAIEHEFPLPYGEVSTGVQLFMCGPDTALQEVARTHTTDGTVAVPPMVFTLPHTGRYVMVIRGAGPYSATYSVSLQEYLHSPASVARDQRDVVLTWSDDGGATWAPLRCLSDGPPRYTDLQPQLLVDERGWVHVAWYDFREDGECGTAASLYWRMSRDGGLTFDASRQISDAPSSWMIDFPYYSIAGDHLAMATQGTNLHFMWVDTRDEVATGIGMGPEIYTASVQLDAPTATEATLAAFGATREAGGVQLRWRVDGVEQVRAFRLHRAVGDGDYEPLAITLPAPSRESAYEALDPTPQPGESYRYRLELELLTGGSRWGDAVSVPTAAPERLALRSLQPNPFADRMTVLLSSGHAGPVDVTVHDLRGARVATLHRGALPAGERRLSWSGVDDLGRALPPGLYLVRAQSATETAVRRVTRVR